MRSRTLTLVVSLVFPLQVWGAKALEGTFMPVCSPTDTPAMKLTVPLPEDRRLELVLWAGGLKALAPKAKITVKEKAKDGTASVCGMRDGRCTTVGGVLQVVEYGAGKVLRGRFDYTESGAKRSTTFELTFREPRGSACAGK